MKNHAIILDLFNKTLQESFFNQAPLTLEELKLDNNYLVFNENDNNVFDAVLDIIVFSVGAIHKSSKLTNTYPIDLAHSLEEKNILSRIVKWNEARNLNTYNFRRELAFIIEEVFEATYDPHNNSHDLSFQIVDKYLLNLVLQNQHSFKKTQAFFINLYHNFSHLGKEFAQEYSPSDFYYYLNKVMDANETKGKKTDGDGKVLKDKTTFKAPEEEFTKK